MFAVVQIAGRQYRVEEGGTFVTDRLTKEAGSSFMLDRVLLVADGEDVRVGRPFVEGASVEVRTLGDLKGEKVRTFKYRRRKDSAKTVGHRRRLTALTVLKINT